VGRGRARAAVALLVAVLAAGCAFPDPPVPDPTPEPPQGEVLAQDGFPGMRLDRELLSLSVTDVESVLGELLVLKRQTDRCGIGTAARRGLAIVYDDDTAVLGLVTADPAVRTPEGVGIGSSTEDLATTYGGAASVLDGAVSQTGGSLVLVADLQDPGAAPGPSSLVYGFETDATGRVTRIRAGFWPWVGYTDYCSPEADRAYRTGWPLTRHQGSEDAGDADAAGPR